MACSVVFHGKRSLQNRKSYLYLIHAKTNVLMKYMFCINSEDEYSVLSNMKGQCTFMMFIFDYKI